MSSAIIKYTVYTNFSHSKYFWEICNNMFNPLQHYFVQNLFTFSKKFISGHHVPTALRRIISAQSEFGVSETTPRRSSEAKTQKGSEPFVRHRKDTALIGFQRAD